MDAVLNILQTKITITGVYSVAKTHAALVSEGDTTSCDDVIVDYVLCSLVDVLAHYAPEECNELVHMIRCVLRSIQHRKALKQACIRYIFLAWDQSPTLSRVIHRIAPVALYVHTDRDSISELADTWVDIIYIMARWFCPVVSTTMFWGTWRDRIPIPHMRERKIIGYGDACEILHTTGYFSALRENLGARSPQSSLDILGRIALRENESLYHRARRAYTLNPQSTGGTQVESTMSAYICALSLLVHIDIHGAIRLNPDESGETAPMQWGVLNFYRFMRSAVQIHEFIAPTQFGINLLAANQLENSAMGGSAPKEEVPTLTFKAVVAIIAMMGIDVVTLRRHLNIQPVSQLSTLLNEYMTIVSSGENAFDNCEKIVTEPPATERVVYAVPLVGGLSSVKMLSHAVAEALAKTALFTLLLVQSRLAGAAVTEDDCQLNGARKGQTPAVRNVARLPYFSVDVVSMIATFVMQPFMTSELPLPQTESGLRLGPYEFVQPPGPVDCDPKVVRAPVGPSLPEKLRCITWAQPRFLWSLRNRVYPVLTKHEERHSTMAVTFDDESD